MFKAITTMSWLGIGKISPKSHLLFYSFILRYWALDSFRGSLLFSNYSQLGTHCMHAVLSCPFAVMIYTAPSCSLPTKEVSQCNYSWKLCPLFSNYSPELEDTYYSQIIPGIICQSLPLSPHLYTPLHADINVYILWKILTNFHFQDFPLHKFGYFKSVKL